MPITQASLLDSRVLIIDDEELNVRLVARFLEFGGYTNVRTLTDSSKAMETIREFSPDIVLLDLLMPPPDGHAILTQLQAERSAASYLPVLVFTADNTPETRTRALDGGAADFLTKPGDAQEIQLRVRNFLQARRMHVELQHHNAALEERVRARTKELEQARREALAVLARAAEFRDDDTGRHTVRVGELSARIAQEMGASEPFVAALSLAAPLHDVGKIGLADSILLKPGRLDPDELATMRRHTIAGGEVFLGVESPLLTMAREIALSHHERWDGSGYPEGIAGEAIPLAARIVAVADVYDALTNERPYKKAWTHEDALAEIQNCSGTHFDPVVAAAFVRLWENEEARAA